MTVAFPPEIESFVEREVSTGEFSSREELIVAAVDLLRQQKAELARLRAEIDKGLEGEGIPAEEVFARLRAKYAVSGPGDG